MSIFQTDLVLSSAIQVALADLRRNKFLLEDAYSCLRTDPYMKDLYGEKEIQRFKAFIDKQIAIYVEHRPPDKAIFPAIVIRLGGGQEDAPKDALGDSFDQEFVDPSTLGGAFDYQQILVGPTTPVSYDYLTGKVIFDSDVDLYALKIFAGQFVYDNVNKQAYEIKLITSENELFIEEGSKPDLTNMTIINKFDTVSHVRKSMWVYETHTITLLAADAQDILYLYTVMMYILNRYKKTLLDARNFAISTIGYSAIYRASPEGDPNNLYGRDITLRGRVEHSWIESTSQRIEGLNTELLVSDAKTSEGIIDQVEHQGWKMEYDEYDEPTETTEDE